MRRSSSPYASSFSFGPGPLSTALKALIGANVVMFLAQSVFPVLTEVFGLHPAWVIPALSTLVAEHAFWVWQLATYMFLHGGVFHILFNMLALWMFGAELERIWGTRYFLKFYFVTGIGAGVLTVLFFAAAVRFAQQLQYVDHHRRVGRDLRPAAGLRDVFPGSADPARRLPGAGENRASRSSARLRSFLRSANPAASPTRRISAVWSSPISS